MGQIDEFSGWPQTAALGERPQLHPGWWLRAELQDPSAHPPTVQIDADHVAHVAKLSLAMFDALGEAGLHELAPDDRELLWAACMLHDIGVTIDYDDHHRHSHYLIVNTGLPGYSPRELELIALIARWHRKGTPDAEQLGALGEPGDGRRLLLLCGIIRLAEQLERSRDRSVAGVRLERRKRGIVLHALANGSRADAGVALWSAQRSSGLLAEAVGGPVEIVAG